MDQKCCTISRFDKMSIRVGIEYDPERLSKNLLEHLNRSNFDGIRIHFASANGFGDNASHIFITYDEWSKLFRKIGFICGLCEFVSFDNRDVSTREIKEIRDVGNIHLESALSLANFKLYNETQSVGFDRIEFERVILGVSRRDKAVVLGISDDKKNPISSENQVPLKILSSYDCKNLPAELSELLFNYRSALDSVQHKLATTPSDNIHVFSKCSTGNNISVHYASWRDGDPVRKPWRVRLGAGSKNIVVNLSDNEMVTLIFGIHNEIDKILTEGMRKPC